MRKTSVVIGLVILVCSIAEAKSWEVLFSDFPVFSEAKSLILIPKPIKDSKNKWFVGEYGGKTISSAPFHYDTHRGVQIENKSSAAINLALIVEYGGIGGKSGWHRTINPGETYSQDFKGTYRTVKKITAEWRAAIPAGADPVKAKISLWH